MSRDDVTRLTSRLERFQLSNANLSRQLSDAINQSQRFASSLGFRDIYEAQAVIDTTDGDLTYKQCLEEVGTLRQQVHDLTAQRDGALARVRELEAQIQTGSLHISDGVRQRNVVLDKIAVDVLPQAIRLAHCDISGFRQCDVDELPAEGQLKLNNLSDRALEILDKNARVVKEWEDIFSRSYKDRKSKSSRLTKAESSRFQRALYRIMLVCWLYGMGSIPESDMQQEDYENYPYEFLEKYQARQTKLLEQYSTTDLYEINRVVRSLLHAIFIAQLRDPCYQSVCETYDWNGLYLFSGPTYILTAYHNKEADVKEDIQYRELMSYIGDDGPYSDFITCSLKAVLQRRGEDTFDSHFKQRILDNVAGEHDLCVRCQNPSEIYQGNRLENESSWDDMKFSHIISDFSLYVQGTGLKYPETGLLQKEVRKIPSRQLIEKIFAHRQGDYTSWKESDWVCSQCWSGLIWDTIPIWWAQQRTTTRDV